MLQNSRSWKSIGRTDANKIEIQNSFSTGKITGGNWSELLWVVTVTVL